jgi:hypothetical protein
MKTLTMLVIASVSLLLGGCCDESVVARAFVGHKTESDCKRLMNLQEPPVSIICPGTEVTVCWGAEGVDNTNIVVSPDPGGVSGTHDAAGVLYLKPADTTTVEIVASDCASTTKQIQVINGETPATFDASWDAFCSLISYRLDPAFVDEKAQTIDVTAEWEPTFEDDMGGSFTCPTPPFLSGAHPKDLHFFNIDEPFLTHAFTRKLSAIEDWNYKLDACQGIGYKCNPAASLPFAMTLICPAP